MKFLQSFITTSLIILVLFGYTKPSISQELPASGSKSDLLELIPTSWQNNAKVGKATPLGTNFRILDSLQNAYSYFTNAQQPFVYYPPKNMLVTIKRGANVAGAANNTLHDLYFLTSNDWGMTWTQPELLFNYRTFGSYYGRYPSIYPFEYDGMMAYVYTAPVTDGSGWKGFINGLYFDGVPIPTVQTAINISGTTYGWGGTDSKIVGGEVGADPFGLAVGGLMPATGLPLDNTSNIGMRKTTDFEDWPVSIPAAWAANKYITPQPQPGFDDSLRTSSVLSLKKELSNNKLYMAAFATFVAAENTERRLPGVSISEDNGESWSEFEIFPWSVISDYAISKQVNPQAVFISAGAYELIVFPNGDYSYIVGLNEDTTVTGTLYANALHLNVELYKEGTQFGIREISQNSGYVLAYLGNTGNNQMGNELMASRTVDGTKILAKWVDFIDAVTTEGDTIRNYSTDIFVSVRDKSSNTWSRIKNITESEIYDRITWVPDLIPNDLKNVPILKLESIPNAFDTPEEARARQRSLENDPQYVLIGNFDADELLIVSVDDNPSYLEIGNVYPNPAGDKVMLDMNLPESGKMIIELVDMYGRTISKLHDNFVNGGISSLSLNLGEQLSGVYFLKINYNGRIISKTINVIK